jgi:hypothetical protein
MFGKLNVLPIIRGHIRTLTSGEVTATPKILKRDLVVFYLLPAIVACALAWPPISMPSGFVDFLVVTFTIFIPLLVNVLFSIFSIQDRPQTPSSAKSGAASRQLLADIYLNLSYSIVVAFAAVGVLGMTKLIGQPRCIDLSERFWEPFNRIAIFTIWWGAYFLTIHLAHTLLMIVKRTYVLLGNEYLAQKNGST